MTARSRVAPTLRLVMAEGAKHRDPEDRQAARELWALLAYAEHAHAMHESGLPHKGLPCRSCDLWSRVSGSGARRRTR